MAQRCPTFGNVAEARDNHFGLGVVVQLLS